MNLPQQCSTVAVVGNGIIGHGVAQIFAMAGRDVRMIGRSEPSLSAALRKIESSLKEFAAHGLLEAAEPREVVARIEITTDLNRAAGSDLILEAVTENLDLKREIFAR